MNHLELVPAPAWPRVGMVVPCVPATRQGWLVATGETVYIPETAEATAPAQRIVRVLGVAMVLSESRIPSL
jgi:hypothetical protein